MIHYSLVICVFFFSWNSRGFCVFVVIEKGIKRMMNIHPKISRWNRRHFNKSEDEIELFIVEHFLALHEEKIYVLFSELSDWKAKWKNGKLFSINDDDVLFMEGKKEKSRSNLQF